MDYPWIFRKVSHGQSVGQRDVGVADLYTIVNQLNLSASVRAVKRCGGKGDNAGEDERYHRAIPRFQGNDTIILVQLCEMLVIQIPDGNLAGVLCLKVCLLDGKRDMERDWLISSNLKADLPSLTSRESILPVEVLQNGTSLFFIYFFSIIINNRLGLVRLGCTGFSVDCPRDTSRTRCVTVTKTQDKRRKTENERVPIFRARSPSSSPRWLMMSNDADIPSSL